MALPDGLPVEMGAHAEPLAVALEAVTLARAGPGDAALVYGAGTIGLNVIMCLRLAGVDLIVAAGRSPGPGPAHAAGRRRAAAGGQLRLSSPTYQTAVDHIASGRVPVADLISERGAWRAYRMRWPGCAPPGNSSVSSPGPQSKARTMDQFAGKVAAITGAGSGMGKAFATRFATEGMKIVAADIQPDALAAGTCASACTPCWQAGCRPPR